MGEQTMARIHLRIEDPITPAAAFLQLTLVEKIFH